MSSKTAVKPAPATTATKNAAVVASDAAYRAANPTKPVRRAADPDIGGESFDYAT